MDTEDREHAQDIPMQEASPHSAHAPSPDAPYIQSIPYAQRLDAVRDARNPLLEAASVLLRAQADLYQIPASRSAIIALRTLLEQELHSFQRLCEQMNIRRDHVIAARYCLCTALDEAAMQTDWALDEKSSAEWMTHGLVTIFQEDRQGGDKIYLLIGRLLAEPQEHRDLLELIYRVLSQGFEGRFRYEVDGWRQHEAIRQRLIEELPDHQRTLTALAPHALPAPNIRRHRSYGIPVWITALTLSVLTLATLFYAKYRLDTPFAQAQQQIAAIGRASVPTPSSSASLDLDALLQPDILAGRVSVHTHSNEHTVTFHDASMFASGTGTLQSSSMPLIRKVAQAMNRFPGQVTITGHTDNVPIHRRDFANNTELSRARAESVMHAMQSVGIAAARLHAHGVGEADPIGDNATPEGRAHNRRVDVSLVIP